MTSPKPPGCSYLLLTEDAKNRMKSKVCNQPVTPSGFCAEHAYCRELLNEASAAGYPPFVVAYDRHEAIYTIGEGRLNWQGYAQRHRRSRHGEIMRRLRDAAIKHAA